MPLKGDIWSQMPPTGDSWMGKCQMRERNRNQRQNNQMDWNRRRHTVTEIPSLSVNECGGYQPRNHHWNNPQMASNYDKPLAINIPDNETLQTTKQVDCSGGAPKLGIVQQNQGNKGTFSIPSSKTEQNDSRTPTFGRTGTNSLKQAQPFGWSHVSAFVPPNHWKRPDVPKLYQTDKVIPPMNTPPSSHQIQNRGMSVGRETKELRNQQWDHQNNEFVPTPTIRKKKPVAQRRHTVDVVPKQREINLEYESIRGNRYQMAQNVSDDRSRVTNSVTPPERTTTNVTQISFDAMLGIIHQMSNSSSNQTGQNTIPMETSVQAKRFGTSYTDVLRIDEESLVPSANQKVRQGPYGQELSNQVYSKGRSPGPNYSPCSPSQYTTPPMPTINEDPFMNRKSMYDDSRNILTGKTRPPDFQNHNVIANSMVENRQTSEKYGPYPVQQTSKQQRPHRTRKQPSLKNMLGVSSLNSHGQNSFNAIIQPFSSSSTVTQNTSLSFNERIDSLTKKWMTKKEGESPQEFQPTGTNITTNVPISDVSVNCTPQSLEIQQTMNRKRRAKKLSSKKSHGRTQLPDEPYNNNNNTPSMNLSSNSGSVNAVVTYMKKTNEEKSTPQAPKKHIASFTLSGLTPACIYITLPQVRFFCIYFYCRFSASFFTAKVTC